MDRAILNLSRLFPQKDIVPNDSESTDGKHSATE